MSTFTSKLHYNTDRVKKDGNASVYLRLIFTRKKKDFPLNLQWPADKIDLANGLLLPRFKKDPDVADFNLIIQIEKARHTEIQRTYRIRNETLTFEKFEREIKIFDSKECFATYFEMERNRRFKRKEIEKKTWQNHGSCKRAILRYDPLCLFKDIDAKWMKGYKSHLQNIEYKPGHRYKPGSIWKFICTTKAYLVLASTEPMLYVDQGAIDFANPKTSTITTFLNEEELRRLIILLDGDLTGRQLRVLQAFLFTCFTSLRISDVYCANAEWEVEDGFIQFIPHKNRKRGREIKIPLLPMARKFIRHTGFYFELPNQSQYNETLKELADKAEINKNITSHVGRHTFGFL